MTVIGPTRPPPSAPREFVPILFRAAATGALRLLPAAAAGGGRSAGCFRMP
jgi:hypothetical protein